MRAARTSAGLAAGLLAVTACGGGSDDAAIPARTGAAVSAAATAAPAGDAAEIVALARSIALATGPGDICDTDMTTRFVRTTFGSVAGCEEEMTPDGAEDRTVAAEMTEVRVDGLSATGTITEHGPQGETVRGTWAFAKVGDTWRLAVWGVDYVRSGLRAAFGPTYHSDGPDDPLDDPRLRSCVSERIQRMTDAALEVFFRKMARETAEAKATFVDLWTACAVAPGKDGRSPLRQAFERGLRQGLEQQGLAPIAECIAEVLRDTVTDEEILRASKRDIRPPSMQRRIDEAGVGCASAAQGVNA